MLPNDEKVPPIVQVNHGVIHLSAGEGIDLKLPADGGAGRVVSLCEYAEDVAGGVGVDPDDDALAGAVDGHVRKESPRGGVAVDQESVTVGGSVAVVPPRVDVRPRVRVVPHRPGDEEVSRVADPRGDVSPDGGDQELPPVGAAVGGVPLAVYLEGPARLMIPLPHDDELARPRHRDVGVLLVPGRDGIDAELPALRRATGIVSLRIDAGFRSVLAIAVPDDHEVARIVHRDPGTLLVAGRVGVDLKLLAPWRSVGIVHLGEYACAVAVLVLTGPGDHEVALAVRRPAPVRPRPVGRCRRGPRTSAPGWTTPRNSRSPRRFASRRRPVRWCCTGAPLPGRRNAERAHAGQMWSSTARSRRQ